ncbi:hypothetical protein GALMADRAFT_161228 [Galerina marginata CBS 339.88]|uniref:F-box domain-containing protein n=1 Tax=Galerina marginata (strain CBS 339.88) TaxID=685588 RepID=A0A067SBB6_GALM3|nr:hypothetical protein GALMADRAFT_161228 [Galerina marginata CBS 339.88]
MLQNRPGTAPSSVSSGVGPFLDSPSIWGKLINFNDFCDSKYQWMEEVLRRSGSCLLWINGRVHGRTADQTDALETFFFAILNDHWNRIQKIQICVDHFDEKDRHNWRAIFCPAPHLQVFEVHPPLTSIPWFSLPPLFADYAPSLHVFDAESAFPVSPKAPWLSTLRIVCRDLDFPLKLPQLLDELGTMHLLESLTISMHSFIPNSETRPITNTDKPTIHLPNLSQLHIHSDLPTALRIIAALQRPKKIWLTGRFREFLFSDCDSAFPDELQMSAPFFSVQITSPLIPSDYVRSLLRTLSLPPTDMSSVMHIHVNAETHFSYNICSHFFSSLSSIKNITINEDTISYLSFIEVHQAFPLLRLVRFREEVDRQTQTVINSFEASRNAAGRPVLIVSLPK